jgi:hypothetical protein
MLMLGLASMLSAATISGIITDETALPFDHSNVQLIRMNSNNSVGGVFRNTLSDPVGSYTFVNIPIGDYKIAAVAPEYEQSFYTDPITGDILVVEVDADDQEIVGINIQLLPHNDPPPHNTGAISGRVFNLAGIALPSVPMGIVNAANPTQPMQNFMTQTNMNGFYMFHNLVPGTYKTCVMGPNQTIVAMSADAIVVANETTDSVDIIFDAPPPPQLGSITGNVIGAQNQMNSNLNVGLVTFDDVTTVLPGLIGHVSYNGSYWIRNIPVGLYKACVIGLNNTPVAYSEPFAVIPNQQIENIDIVLGTAVGFSISGSVVNTQNLPVPYGVVQIRSAVNNNPNGNMNYIFRVAHLDSLGNYVLNYIPAGQYIVSVWTPHTPPVFYPSTFIIDQATPVIITDASVTGINITIPIVPTYSISGYVRDADTQAPLAGIRIRTDRMGFHHFPVNDPILHNEFLALTDADGFYSFTAPIGRYTLAAMDTTHTYRVQFYDLSPTPFNATMIFLDHDYTNINFALVPRLDSLFCSISGTVTENDEPVTYPVMVVAVSSDEDWEESTITDALGNYTINHVRPGNYFVTAYSLFTPPTYYNNVLTWEDADLVAVNGHITGIDFHLVNTPADGPNNLNGVVTDAVGYGLNNVIVSLKNSQNQVIAFARTDANGSYTIENIPAQTYTVVATKLGLNSLTQTLILDGNESVNMTLYATTANEDHTTPVLTSKMYNYPNPFNPVTNIALSIPKDSRVNVQIYNIKGQIIKNLLDNNLKAGSHTLKWDGTDDSGKTVTSGVYLVRLSGDGFKTNHKLTLMK